MASRELADGLGVADVVDAMMMTHDHRAHVIDLVSPDPERLLIGPAVCAHLAAATQPDDPPPTTM
ncbi:MAG: hypothetical protein ACR2RF_32750 [Geminicoccaceae bacterium]